MRRALLPFVMLLWLLSASGCDSGPSNEGPDPQKGPISRAEFEALSPTYEQVIVAFEKVTEEDPSLIQDSEALSRAVFDHIKNLSSDTATSSTKIERKETTSALFITGISWEEWQIFILNPLDTISAFRTVSPSRETATQSYPCDEDISFARGKADALRHAYWSALMTKRVGLDLATQIGVAHEDKPDNDPYDKAMDLHNNRVGRNVATAYPEATEEQILELLLEQRYLYVPYGTHIPEDAEGLVYIDGRRSYDGAFTGSLTNPDSGGPWVATFYLNQCNATIRGRFEITRGEEFQERRFSGRVESGSMSLDVSEPYTFENPRGLDACIDMEMQLEGDTKSLSGSWTSSNCRQGGTINISVL